MSKATDKKGGFAIMKTYQVVYTEANKPGKKVMLVQANDPYSAKLEAERNLMGSWGNFNCPYTFWEVKEL